MNAPPSSEQSFSTQRPISGDPVTYAGKQGTVVKVEGDLCWVRYSNQEPQPFIWRFKEGLNTQHQWPTKGVVAEHEATTDEELRERDDWEALRDYVE